MRVRVRAVRALAALGLGLSASLPLALASTSGAGAAASITISDQTTPGAPPYVDGDTLTVSGTAASPSQKTVTIYECEGDPSLYPGGTMISQATVTSKCDSRNLVTVTTNQGSFSTSMTYVGWIVPASGAGFDCSSTSSTPSINGCTVLADPSNTGGATIDASMAAQGTNNSCNGGFQGADFTANGGFNKSVTINGQPATNGTPVQPGTTIKVTLAWSPSNFTGQQDMVLDCIATTTDGVNFTIDQTQSQASLQKPVPTGESSYTSSYTVPASDTGLQICDRGRVSGVGANGNPSTEKSNRFCFTVAPGTFVPETSHPVLLAVGGVLIGVLALGAVEWTRRRRARSNS